jgi:dihydrodipicolinate synthase/N-acetylneuraminate lyase
MSQTTQAGDLKGVLPVLQMPFGPGDEVDADALRHEIDWAFGHGADGVTTGMVSEVLRLTDRERQEVVELVAEAAGAAGRTSVVSCGGESSRDAVERGRQAARAGVTAVMAIPPLSVALGDDAIYGYYAALVEALDIPVVVQDASGYVGRPMSIGVQARLFDAYQDRVYFKPETPPLGPRLTELMTATGGAARVIEGSGGIALVDAYRRGIVATMPATDLCWALKRLWDALETGDEETAYRIASTLALMISVQTSIDSYVAVEKHLLVRQGVLPSTSRRGPYDFEPDEAMLAEVDRLFERLHAEVFADAEGRWDA